MTFGPGPKGAQVASCKPLVSAFDACIDRKQRESGDKYLEFHARRYKVNFASMCHRLDWDFSTNAGWRVLELGAGSVFTTCFMEAAPSIKHEVWGNYVKDLREPFATVPSAAFDLVICQEVIEHIADPNTNALDMASFLGRGIANLVSESYRVLKPGALLMVTTPNVASHQQVLYALVGIHPFSNLHHVREMSKGDAYGYMQAAGFTDLASEFLNTWRPVGPSSSEAKIEAQMMALAQSLADLLANQALERIGVDMGRMAQRTDLAEVPRHDNAFYYARKPA